MREQLTGPDVTPMAGGCFNQAILNGAKAEQYAAPSGSTERSLAAAAPNLQRAERKILEYLQAAAPRIVSSHELLTEVLGYSPDMISRTIDVHICRLRRKGFYIETVRRQGYRLVAV